MTSFSGRAVLALVTLMLGGCMSSTQMIKNDSANVKVQEYGDLYFLRMDKDPRNIAPRAIAEFQAMGFNVKVVDPGKPIEGAQGTGFVISSEGHVLTCAHVLGDQKVATLWIAGVRYEADVVTADQDKDLAVLKPRRALSPEVNPLSFQNDDKYSIGADVSTTGYPLGNVLGNSIRYTKGSISSTSRASSSASSRRR